MKVEIINTERVFDGFFKIDEVTLQHEKFDGTMSEEIKRLNFNRGNSVAAVVHNKSKDTLLFTKQFRYPVYTAYPTESDEAWIIEIIAGMVKDDEGYEEAMEREIKEELGYQIYELKLINIFFVSPGGTNEQITLYYAEVSDQDQIEKGGGIEKEQEDIKVIEIPTERAFEMVESLEIMDAKTIIGLNWLKMNY